MTVYRFPEVHKALQGYYRQIGEHKRSLENQDHDIVQPFTSFSNSAYMFADTYAMYTNIDGRQTISAQFSQHDVEVRLKYMLLDLVFVPFMSTAEYHAIKLGQRDPQSASYAKIQQKTERRTHLSDLIELIPQLDEKRDVWDFAIHLRNDYVHFDGYARTSMTCPIKGTTIVMKEGERSGCTMGSLFVLLGQLESSFFSFTSSFITLH